MAFVVIGFVISNALEHGFWVSMFALAVPVIGWFLFKRTNQKQIGAGMLISSISIGLLAIAFIFLSKLH